MLGPSRVGAWAIRGLAIDPSSCSLSRCVRSSAAFSHMVIMRSRRHVAMGHRRLGLQSMDRLFQRKNFLRLAAEPPEIGRAHVRTPVTNAHLVCRLLLEKKKRTHNKKDSKQKLHTTNTNQ